MSSAATVKGMVIRTPQEACHQRVVFLKGLVRFGSQSQNRLLSQPSRGVAVRGSLEPNKRNSNDCNKPNISRPQAILSPVSDPTAPTTKKLGGKGANLAEIASIGLSVPPGLTISTEACQEYQQKGKKLPQGLWEEILNGLSSVEREMGSILGDPSKPLLLSVRSGAAISMPGMMETVLNLGLNDEVVAGLAEKSGQRFAYDLYRRFLDMFGDVVMGIPHSKFEEKLENLKIEIGFKLDTDLTASDLKELIEQYKSDYLETKGAKFPSDLKQQLQLSVKAVFDS